MLSAVPQTHRPDNLPTTAMSEVAYERLRQAILNNLLPPGAKIVENEIGRTLGMSRTPIREALSRLMRDGLVEAIGLRGVRVSLVRSSELQEIYDVLAALESQAAALLARRPLKERRPAIAAMQAALTGMEDALARNDLPLWSDLDGRFHYALFEGCGSSRLARMASTEIDLGRRSRILTLHRRKNLEQSNVEHSAILRAVRSGAPEEARQAMLAHRERTAAIIVPLVRELEKGAI
jgi:DNA-binding GntR family transcriptional regulator